MKRLLLLTVLGCGGVDLVAEEACRDQVKKTVAMEGCEFRWAACVEQSASRVECDFGMLCPGGDYREAVQVCIEVKLPAG